MGILVGMAGRLDYNNGFHAAVEERDGGIDDLDDAFDAVSVVKELVRPGWVKYLLPSQLPPWWSSQALLRHCRLKLVSRKYLSWEQLCSLDFSFPSVPPKELQTTDGHAERLRLKAAQAGFALCDA